VTGFKKSSNMTLVKDVARYIRPAMECWAKERMLEGKIPMYRVPAAARIKAMTEAEENTRIRDCAGVDFISPAIPIKREGL